MKIMFPVPEAGQASGGKPVLNSRRGKWRGDSALLLVGTIGPPGLPLQLDRVTVREAGREGGAAVKVSKLMFQ